MGQSSIPGWGTKILQAMWHNLKKKKKAVYFKRKQWKITEECTGRPSKCSYTSFPAGKIES